MSNSIITTKSFTTARRLKKFSKLQLAEYLGTTPELIDAYEHASAPIPPKIRTRLHLLFFPNETRPPVITKKKIKTPKMNN